MVARMLRGTALCAAILGAMVGTTETASAAVLRSAVGTFQTPARQGVFKFVTVKAVRIVNTTAYQGNFNIGVRSFPGVMFPTPDGRMSMAWYYGSTGITAGQGIAAKQADGSYSGPIDFLNRNGSISEQGTATFKLGF